MKTTRHEFLQTAAGAGLVLMIDAPAFAAACEPEDLSPTPTFISVQHHSPLDHALVYETSRTARP